MEKENFKEWLIQNGYTENTSVSYANAIGKISSNENIDVYTLNDLPTIEKLVKSYSTTGKHAVIGYEGSGAVRSAIKAFWAFKKDTDNDDELFKLTDFEIADQMIYGFSYKANLRKSILRDKSKLFPGFKLFRRNKEGFEYSIEESTIDILLENTDGDILAVKLEPGVADLDAFGELATHIGFLIERFPERRIKGSIIAGEIESGLKRASKVTSVISLKTYKMNLELEDVL